VLLARELADDLGPDDLSTGDYFDTIRDEVQNKSEAGYNTTVTDYWGRALSFQLVNATNGGPGIYSLVLHN
jgi:lysophospholipase